MPPKKLAFYYFFCIFIGLIIFVVYLVYVVVKTQNQVLKYQAIDKISNSDSTNAAYDKDLRLPKSYAIIMTMNSKTRQPIETFKIDTSTFCYVYQLPVKSSAPISKILTIQNGPTSPESDVGYYGLTFPPDLKELKCEISYKEGAPVSGNRINLKIESQNLKLVENSDTVYRYTGRFKSFGLCYADTSKADFIGYIKPKYGNMEFLPIDITFKKVNDRYYFLLYVSK